MANRFAVLLVTLPVLALATVAVSPTAAAPTARPGDIAATRVYIQANYALSRAAVANLPPGRAALTSLVHQTAADCPGAAAGSPENGEAEQLSDEVIGALSVAAFRLDARPIASFAHAVDGLRWSDRRLTRMVRLYAAKLQSMATLAMPDLCGDMHAWAAAGFQTLPPGTPPFVRRFLAARIETEEVSPALLARYEQPGEAAVERRTGQLEGRIVEAEAQAVHDWSRILEVLGLNP